MQKNFFIRQSFWDFLVGLGWGWFENNFSIWKFFKSSRSILSKWTFRAKKVTRIFLLEIGKLMELGFAGEKNYLDFALYGERWIGGCWVCLGKECARVMDGIGWALAQAKVVFQDGRHFYEKIVMAGKRIGRFWWLSCQMEGFGEGDFLAIFKSCFSTWPPSKH